MKNKTIIVTLIFLLISLQFIVGSAFAQDKGYKVGDIQISLLNPVRFKQLHGTDWVLMDGSSIANTELAAILGVNNAPDARGTFLRMKNHKQSRSKGNADGELNIGEYQKDSLSKDHIHRTQYWGTCSGGGGGAFSCPHGGSAKSTTTASGPTVRDETRPRNITVNFYVKIR